MLVVSLKFFTKILSALFLAAFVLFLNFRLDHFDPVLEAAGVPDFVAFRPILHVLLS